MMTNPHNHLYCQQFAEVSLLECSELVDAAQSEQPVGSVYSGPVL